LSAKLRRFFNVVFPTLPVIPIICAEVLFLFVLAKLFKEETSKIKKVVGIYGGRFQPFGPHHKKTYEWMKKKFDDVYITTSNIKKPPKHPMNFKEKVRHMTKMGIPSSKIIQERTPYVATNTMKKFDKETNAVVYAFGAKEGSRLKGGKYFKDYKKNKKSLEGFWKHGYVLTAPHVSMKAAGMEVSGTTMRKLLGSPEYADDRERRFKKYFGYFDKSVFNMMIGKFISLWYVSVSTIAGIMLNLSSVLFKGDTHKQEYPGGVLILKGFNIL